MNPSLLLQSTRKLLGHLSTIAPRNDEEWNQDLSRLVNQTLQAMGDRRRVVWNPDAGSLLDAKGTIEQDPAIIITLPNPDPRLHAHATGHWTKKKGPTKELRELAFFKAKQAITRRWDRAEITYRFFFPDRRRRDQSNAIQSMKAAVDGVVDAGLIPDDDWQHLSIAGVDCFVDRDNPRTELVFRRVLDEFAK